MQTVYYQKVKVPNSMYSVKAWSASAKSFQTVNSTVFCHDNAFENGYSISDCDLFVENKVDAKSLSWLQVSYDPFAPVSAPAMNKFKYETENSRGSLFSINSQEDNSSRYMALQLRYYRSDEGGDNYANTDNVPSGAYIFKPAKDQQYSLPFVNVTSHSSLNASFV